MGQKDITEKLLEDYNDVFADIINVLLFDGEERVLPDSLVDTKTKSQYKADDSKLHEQERDVAKFWQDKNITFALYGIENQTKSEKVMPLRILGYDGTAYRGQLLKGKSDQLYPVLTIVLYFGKGHWNQPKNLKKAIKIPRELDKYINDYKINVFEISWLTDEQVSKFKSDFRIVAEFFTQIRKNNKYEPTPQEIKHVDEVLKLLSVFGGAQKFETLITSGKSKEVKNMCEAIDKMIAEGAAHGEAISLLHSIENLQKNLKLSLEDALHAIGKTMEDYEKAQQLLEQM